jgi:hypothetical protein
MAAVLARAAAKARAGGLELDDPEGPFADLPARPESEQANASNAP